jgi:hypothetical protein
MRELLIIILLFAINGLCDRHEQEKEEIRKEYNDEIKEMKRGACHIKYYGEYLSVYCTKVYFNNGDHYIEKHEALLAKNSSYIREVNNYNGKLDTTIIDYENCNNESDAIDKYGIKYCKNRVQNIWRTFKDIHLAGSKIFED